MEEIKYRKIQNGVLLCDKNFDEANFLYLELDILIRGYRSIVHNIINRTKAGLALELYNIH